MDAIHKPTFLFLILSILITLCSSQATGYNCDPTTCRLPDCACASATTPGGLALADTPQFIVFTADDAVQESTITALRSFLYQRRNPNGCRPKSTYFASLPYTNYSHVTEWYVDGNEIADHTMTHAGTPSAQEINGALISLNALAGIPLSAMKGFRAPYLQYDVSTLTQLKAAKFLYDSSATSVAPVTTTGEGAVWPYTLDHGLVNNCLDVPGICNGLPQIPGLWEIPMYATFDDVGSPHMMDPWLDRVADAAGPFSNWLRGTFTAHYTTNRLPIGIYMHPIHLVPTQGDQGLAANTTQLINAYLDWAQTHDNVWIVSNEQLLEWVRNPVPASQLGAQSYMSCPGYPQTPNICNGIPEREAGLIDRCFFSDFTFYTCYGCPQAPPSLAVPNPAQNIASGQVTYRTRVPANCSTVYWDPIGGSCTCQSGSCAFQDESRPIGPQGSGYLGGGTNENPTDVDGGTTMDPYQGFSEGVVSMKIPRLLTLAIAGLALFFSG